MKKIKIAYINIMEGYSGGEIVLQRLIRGINRDKFSIYVYSTPTKFIDTLKCNECNTTIINTQYQLKMERGIKAFVKVIKLFVMSGKYIYEMKQKQILIIHSNSLTSNIYFSFWAKIFGIKFIAHSHEIREGIIFTLLHKYICFCSDKIICVSDAVKNNWLSHNVNKKKLTVVYNGVSNDFF